MLSPDRPPIPSFNLEGPDDEDDDEDCYPQYVGLMADHEFERPSTSNSPESSDEDDAVWKGSKAGASQKLTKRKESLASKKSKGILERHYNNVLHFFVEDWFLSALLGTLTALLSIATDVGIEYLLHFKVFLYEWADSVHYILGAIAWIGYIGVCVGGASLFCKLVGPQAVGSGIPELKVIMHGFVMKNYLTVKTLAAKTIGLTFTLGGGLPTGKEGPFVHMGAIVATQLTRMTSSCRYNEFFSNEGRQMEMLSSGCAVGIACTFSAPAGGVLYGIESTSKYFAVKNYWRSFFATTCSALIFRFLMTVFVPPHIAGTITAYYQTNFPNEVFVVEEIPFFVLIGALSGVLAALFVFTHRRLAKAKERGVYKKLFGKRPVLLATLSALIVGFVTYPHMFGEFIAGKLTFRETLADFVANCTFSLTGTNSSHGCSPALLGHWTGSTGELNPMLTLSLYILVYFVLVAHCVSLYVPCGIFVPSFVIGAAGGRLMGEIVSTFFPDGFRGAGGPQIYPGLYAVVGAAAYTGAVTHSLSIAVIVCETTGQLCALLPVLIALMVANAIASFLQPSIYESIILLKNYPYLTDLPPSRISVHTLKVSKVMVRDLFFITKKTTYEELRDILRSSPHLRSYPFVTDKESMCLLGSISRKYLLYLLSSKLGPDPSLLGKKPRTASELIHSTIHSIRRTSPISVVLHFESLHIMRRRAASTNPSVMAADLFTDKNFGEDTLLQPNSPLHDNSHESRSAIASLLTHSATEPAADNLSHGERSRLLDSFIELDTAAIDPAPFQLVKSTTLYKVHTLFSLLALNHAYVTDKGKLVGVVSLRELRETFADIYTRGAQPPVRKRAIAGQHPPTLRIRSIKKKNGETKIEIVNDG